MDLIIDTNMIYNISDVRDKINIDMVKLVNEISAYKNIYVSDLSMLEIYTYYRTDISTLKKIIRSLVELKCSVINDLSDEYTNESNELNTILEDERLLKKLVDDSRSKRIEFESRILYFLSKSIAMTYLCLAHDNDFKYHRDKMMLCDNLQKLMSIEIDDELTVIFRDFYDGCGVVGFKDKIVNYILDLCKDYIWFYYVSDQGICLYDYIKNKGEFSEVKKCDFRKKICNDESLKWIEERRMQKRIVSKEFSRALSIFLKQYLKRLSTVSARPAVIYYYTILFRKFFELEGMKIKKNDVIDSQLLTHYPQKLILTEDKDFIRFINEIDKNYADQIKAVLKNCRFTI